MQKHLSSMNAVGNKNALSIRGPIQGLQIIPVFHMDGLRRVAAQGEDFNRRLRVLADTNACAIRREIPVEQLGWCGDINSDEFRSAAMQRVERRENESPAIVGQFAKHT